MAKLSINEIRDLPGVARANEWKDRIYINLAGNGGNFAGERNSKVWIAASGALNIELGKGTTSREWDANLSAFSAAYEAAAA